MYIYALEKGNPLQESVFQIDGFKKNYRIENNIEMFSLISLDGNFIKLVFDDNEYHLKESDDCEGSTFFYVNGVLTFRIDEKQNHDKYSDNTLSLNFIKGSWKLVPYRKKPFNQKVFYENETYLDTCSVTSSGSQGAVFMSPRLMSEDETQENYDEVSKIFFQDIGDCQYQNPKFDFLRTNPLANDYVFALKRVEKVKDSEKMHYIYDMGFRHREYMQSMNIAFRKGLIKEIYESFWNILFAINFLYENGIIHDDLRYTNYAVDRHKNILKLIDLSNSSIYEMNKLSIINNPSLAILLQRATGIKQYNIHKENFPLYDLFIRKKNIKNVRINLQNLYKRYSLYMFLYSIFEISHIIGIPQDIYCKFLPLNDLCRNYNIDDISEDFCKTFQEIIENF